MEKGRVERVREAVSVKRARGHLSKEVGKITQGRRYSGEKVLRWEIVKRPVGLEGNERGHENLDNLGWGGPCVCWGWVAPPGAQTAGAQTHEDGADEFAKGGGVDRLQLLLLAV